MTHRTPETDLIRVALRWLKLEGIPAWRNHSGQTVIPAQGRARRRVISMGVPGGSDIIGVVPPTGRGFAAEAKIPPNDLTDDQRAFQEDIRAAGGLAFVFRTIEDLERELEDERNGAG